VRGEYAALGRRAYPTTHSNIETATSRILARHVVSIEQNATRGKYCWVTSQLQLETWAGSIRWSSPLGLNVSARPCRVCLPRMELWLRLQLREGRFRQVLVQEPIPTRPGLVGLCQRSYC